ncbi:MAG: DNA translocase FtsK [Chloroflexi bacterium]|nr:DNA translocase FtsK [Chloroflexota bacterium]
MAKKKSSSSKRKTTARGKSTRGGTRKRSTRKKTSRKRTQREIRLSLAQKALIVGISIVFLTIILILSLLSPNQAQLTAGLSSLMRQMFGWGSFIFPLITGSIGLYLVMWGMEQQPQLPIFRLTGFLLLFLSLESLATQVVLKRNSDLADVWAVAQAQQGGGYLGGALTYGLVGGLGELGAVFTLVVVAVLGTILLLGVSRTDISRAIKQLTAPRESGADGSDLPEREIAINNSRTRRAADKEQSDQPPLPLAKSSPATAEPTKTKTKAKQRSHKPSPKNKPEEAPTVVTPVFLGNNGRAGSHNWKLPDIVAMLHPGTDMDPTGAVIREQVEIIEHTLESFGAPATVVEINQGPTITQFGVEPSFLQMRNGKRTKVKVGKIAGLSDDLALALHAQAIRIQAPVPGKGYVGIEVPNPAKALVSLRDVMETAAFKKIKSPLRLGFGQDVAGQPIVADLAKMPHLLIAGATGSGKSVLVNGIIACLLLQNTPDQLKLVMVDPKRVELTGYNGIPHLAAPVVVEMDRVIGVLQWAMREMDARYKMFAEVGARNMLDYNKKIRRDKNRDDLPYIVIIIDELADLMMMSPEETERGVTRLAQLARATGMHMVIATQRPSVDVVTGLIKANFPARVAFAVASGTDSRVILDTTGAERLLGQGDMLFQAPDTASPVRSQGCYVSPEELDKLIAYWRTARRFNMIPATESAQPKDEIIPPPEPKMKAAPPSPADESEILAPVVNMGDEEGAKEETAVTPQKVKTATPKPRPSPPPPKKKKEKSTQPATTQQPLWEALQEEAQQQPEYDDELMVEAIALVRKLNRASTSLLQRRFRIGYTRAARMIDAMEDMNIIGPPTGTSKARQVLPWEDDELAPSPHKDEKGDGEND